MVASSHFVGFNKLTMIGVPGSDYAIAVTTRLLPLPMRHAESPRCRSVEKQAIASPRTLGWTASASISVHLPDWLRPKGRQGAKKAPTVLCREKTLLLFAVAVGCDTCACSRGFTGIVVVLMARE